MRPHSLILQKLDQYLSNFGGQVFYPRKTFETVNYTGKPVILWTGEGYPRHPDFSAVDAGNLPPEFQIVGQITNTAIDGDFQRADAIITDEALDAEISANPSAFAVSSGFWGGIVNGVMSKVFSPNHVLLFRRSVAPNARPNDPMTQVCNVAEQAIFPVSLDTGIQMATNQNQSIQPTPQQVGNAPAPEPAPPEPATETSELDQLRAENEQLKAMVEQLVTKLQELTGQQPPANAPAVAPAAVGNVAAENEQLRAEITQLRKKNADYEWQQLEKTLPPTMQGAAARFDYDQNPTEFLRKALSMRAVGNTAPAPMPAVGATVMPAPQTAEPTTFMTPEYAGARQIGNVKPPESQIEGARIGQSMWMLYGGIKLDMTDINAGRAGRR